MLVALVRLSNKTCNFFSVIARTGSGTGKELKMCFYKHTCWAGTSWSRTRGRKAEKWRNRPTGTATLHANRLVSRRKSRPTQDTNRCIDQSVDQPVGHLREPTGSWELQCQVVEVTGDQPVHYMCSPTISSPKINQPVHGTVQPVH